MAEERKALLQTTSSRRSPPADNFLAIRTFQNHPNLSSRGCAVEHVTAHAATLKRWNTEDPQPTVDEEGAWIQTYRKLWTERFDELNIVVEELKHKEKAHGIK